MEYTDLVLEYLKGFLDFHNLKETKDYSCESFFRSAYKDSYQFISKAHLSNVVHCVTLLYDYLLSIDEITLEYYNELNDSIKQNLVSWTSSLDSISIDEFCLDDYLFEWHRYLTSINLDFYSIKDHLKNIKYFLYFNFKYLGNAEKRAVYSIEEFMEVFFGERFSTPKASRVKQMGTSISRYYKFLLSINRVDKADLLHVKTIIKENMNFWITEYC